jgi:hypothetical protein
MAIEQELTKQEYAAIIAKVGNDCLDGILSATSFKERFTSHPTYVMQ